MTVTFLAFLPTSIPGMGFLMWIYRERRPGAGWYVVHQLLHLMFVLDLVSTALLFAQFGRTSGRPAAAPPPAWQAGPYPATPPGAMR